MNTNIQQLNNFSFFESLQAFLVIGVGCLQAIQNISRYHIVIDLLVALLLILHRLHRSLHPCLVFVIVLVLSVAAARTHADAHIVEIQEIIDMMKPVRTCKL